MVFVKTLSIVKTLLLAALFAAIGLFYLVDKHQTIKRVSITQNAYGYSDALNDLLLCTHFLDHSLEHCTETLMSISNQNKAAAKKEIAKAKCQGYFWESYDPACMAIELNAGEEI